MDDRWHDDEHLLAALAESLSAAEAVPARVVALGEAAFDWRTIDAELAALTYDSAVDPVPDEPALVRAEVASLRSLRFQAPAVAVVLEITDDALVGQILPPRPAGVSLMSSIGEGTDVEADDLGYFVFRPVPRGSFRLLCRTRPGPELLTSWFQL
ncbi:hypothetical protein [Paractinoplanes maris]|uniref:hypothetical protein n=1 Tax=Paractinoplanes maris TaxID=1734446 RepID=UPI002021EE89|nr:hypothetical protein [Actinoplanes maris]